MKNVFACLILIGLSLAGCSRSGGSAPGANGKVVVGLMPKSKDNPYFISVRAGADKAAKDLGIELLFDGPVDPDPAKQNEIIENWIARGVDAIAVACENKQAIADVLRKARAKGIKVITYDSDATADAREFFVNQATSQGIGFALMDEAARLTNNQGEFAIVTGSLTAANMIEWQGFIEQRRASKYPNMKMVEVRSCDDLRDKAQREAAILLNTHPNLNLLLAICAPAVPGAAEAVKQAGKAGQVRVVGLGLPNQNKSYVHEGVTDTVILWNTGDLGYLTVEAAVALKNGTLKAGDKAFKAGKLGVFEVHGDNIQLGPPFLFTAGNIDQFDF